MRTFARGRAAVQHEMILHVTAAVDALFDTPPDSWTVASAERAVWALLLEFGRRLLGALLGLSCCARARAYADERLEPGWRFRLDAAYDATLSTTLGTVVFPWFAIRFTGRDGRQRTCNPAQKQLMPYYRRCRSSPGLLQWECAVGAREPFRQAQASLTRFTHGAVTLEDSTIARHTVAIGQSVDRSWLYRDRADIQHVVLERATRCRQTGRPLVYLSSDAHAVRRYVDETWVAQWKMLNGLRAWCIDRDSGELIHLGGEYTWGDCREVSRALRAAVDAGYLPADGDFGGPERALYIWLSDGMPWFDDYLLPLFEPDALVVVLDAYHVLERARTFATKVHRASKRSATRLYDRLAALVVGTVPKDERATRHRGGPRKGTPPAPNPEPTYPDHHGYLDHAAMLIDAVRSVPATRTARVAARTEFDNYLTANAHRIDYAEYRRRGIAIGSGPMESLHRTASQARLKIPGARWTVTTSHAILNLRLLELVGKTERFWSQPDITERIEAAFDT